MTVREELHRIVDALPEEELAEVRIQEGLEDIKAGRTVSWEQVKRENGH